MTVILCAECWFPFACPWAGPRCRDLLRGPCAGPLCGPLCGSLCGHRVPPVLALVQGLHGSVQVSVRPPGRGLVLVRRSLFRPLCRTLCRPLCEPLCGDPVRESSLCAERLLESAQSHFEVNLQIPWAPRCVYVHKIYSPTKTNAYETKICCFDQSGLK